MNAFDTAQEIKLDLERGRRVGLEEATFCAHKSLAQIEEIIARYAAGGRCCLLTRLSVAQYAAIPAMYRSRIDYDPVSGTGFFERPPAPDGPCRIGVVSAGSSDVPVAREALRTLEYHGVRALPVFDVGVAGLWRLLERVEELNRLPALIVVAGMDAALPSVLGGLFAGLIVAVPTSVGYGVATGGQAALHAILSSCAPGIAVVNIDNGYGAACVALRALRQALSS